MLFKYSSNNSGGRWWLKDEAWKALEGAGWTVKWCRDEVSSYCRPDKEGRWLGALAKEAEKEFETLREAVEEFESVAGANFSNEGCNCCGPPHSMAWEDANGNWGYVDAYDFSSRSRVNPWD